MSRLTIVNARLLTLAARPGFTDGLAPIGPRRGSALRELGIIERGTISVHNERITSITAEPYVQPTAGERIVDAGGCVVMPAFVDCHTHACWAGDRFDEFELRLGGASYLDILKAGGGIMSTVRAVRAVDEDELVELLLTRLARMAALGTGTVEIKSGYGLDTDTELKMLRAIRRASELAPQMIVPTFLGAHAIDPENPHCVEQTITETLPTVAMEFPGITCDAYCEEGAWSLDDARRLFESALDMGCSIRVHADQFNSLGMTRLAADMGAVSVDHLEATTADDLSHLAHSNTVGVALPCSGFHLDAGYMAARPFVDGGGALAIASNYNPGSSPTPSMPFTIALACRKLRLNPMEAITASTWNAACVVNAQDEVGSLEIGKRADILVMDFADERELGHEFATPGPRVVILNGRIVFERQSA
ncbi:MAG TPA: imidazolonepropionase [Phycisphaerales bacterium]|nr:imidazolonepropionase [Phycisphaerales bacterium]HRQ74376.1 imidazolonepropionase [Phycisphaerales bacterium]